MPLTLSYKVPIWRMKRYQKQKNINQDSDMRRHILLSHSEKTKLDLMTLPALLNTITFVLSILTLRHQSAQ